MSAAVQLPSGSSEVFQPAVAENSKSKKIMQAIMEIAIRVLVPFATALLLYFTLPVSIAVFALPLATAASVIATTFLFTKPDPVLPLSATAPCGLKNAGNDCWLNSLAQMMYIDGGMKRWFTEVPDQIVEHAYMFRYFSQDIIENFPEALPDADYGQGEERERVDKYVQGIRNLAESAKQKLFPYLRFLRQFPIGMNPEPIRVAVVLDAFKNFMESYERSVPGQVVTVTIPNRPEPTYFDSHALRTAIAGVFPGINLDGMEQLNEHSQQDPMEALDVLSPFIFPESLKVQIQEKRSFKLPRNKETGRLEPLPDADTPGGRSLIQNEGHKLPIVNCAVQGSYPNARNMLNRFFEEQNSDPTNRITRTIDGTEYEFRLDKTETQFFTAPHVLWLLVKRYRRIQPQWAGLHRMMPNWFFTQPAAQVKNEAFVEFQETLQIKPVQEPLAIYKLDGFICHRGATPKSGHYVSYKLGKDDQNKDAWFEMNDEKVTRLSDAQIQKALGKAYIIHYSKK